MTATPPPLFVSLMYCLDTEQGHILSYNVCFGDACRINGWEHVAGVRAAARVSQLPTGWERALGGRDTHFHVRGITQIEKFLSFVTTTSRYLRRMLGDGSRPTVLFLEWFNLIHLIAFVLALLSIPARQLRSTSVWMNHRFEFSHNWYLSVMRILLAFIDRRTHGRLVTFTENDLVAASHMQTLGRKAHVLPMPQMVTPEEPWRSPEFDRSPDRQNRVVCFWPGQAAPDKGLAIVRRLSEARGTTAQKLVLVADESAGFVQHENGPRIILLKKGMPRDAYIGWLRAMDIALVPYDPAAYAKRTSGIFGDAIAVEHPPIVRDGTWMAHELRGHGLDELIVDWDQDIDLVAQRLVALASDPVVHQKLSALTSNYANFHSRSGYARVIANIYKSRT